MSESIEELKKKVAHYEGNGAAKLFYALNRKMSEMAERLNKTDLVTITLDDPKDKTFDRIKVIWNDAASIAGAVKTLGEVSGASGDELKDIRTPIFRITPENMADNIGELAGKKS